MCSLLNLSGFRAVNDALGQRAGDQVLIEFATRLDALVRVGRFVARLGGDEFAVVAAEVDGSTGATGLAAEILSIVRRPVLIDGKDVIIQARIGIACHRADGSQAEQILDDAEVALGRIRADSATGFQFFSSEMTAAARRLQEIEGELRLALDKAQLQLFYQPKFARAQGCEASEFCSCEALIRWHHPRLGWISPGEFIPIAESSSLITEVGAWVLVEACSQIRRWQDAGLQSPRVAINVAAQQFRDLEFSEMVRAAVRNADIDPACLELEITESAAMSNVNLTAITLASLRKVGVSLSIDDFGTGYSSLSYLKQFDIDSIKIDKSFVDDIGKDANADAICDAIIRLGHSLWKKIVAEGVETRMQADFFRQRRCEEAQGFLFARPMPADEISVRLRSVRVLDAALPSG